MQRLLLPFIFLLACSLLHAQNNWQHGRLKVAPGGHYLQYENGTPFFWLGDTGWELFHRLTLDEIKMYLDNRAAKGMNVIQAVVLAEMDGLRKPNQYGQVPFYNNDPAKPNEAYFKIVDSAIAMALQRKLFVGLLPTWGDKVTRLWGEGPVVFDSVNAYTYGRWIGNRYKAYPNIIWILGGDRPAMQDSNDWRPVWRAMAKGIIEATNRQCIITYHPSGGNNSTSQWIHNEPWLDVNMFQSGHGGGHDVDCWNLVRRDLSYSPVKPTLDAEPNYEDHPVSPWPKWNVDNGYFRDYDVRKQLYRSVFAGACGVTYGHHSIWQFMNAKEAAINYPDRGWINALDRPGAWQAGYLRKLIESRPFNSRVPDTAMLLQGQGVKGEHAEAFRADGDGYAMIYLPVGKPIIANTAIIKASEIKLWWFNPRDASVTEAGIKKNEGKIQLTPPSSGPENDWVLVVEDAGRNYQPFQK
ncbi:glycoside hydrolase family 140 protein [Foetidibacter luteolus]|uniref:glycoside hydrolase family 140 protein n=1 Tax=Foetidibacter luteolus TaxID=2608880 RepID=UPI00129BAC7F|nr:glycoside hydrolase family 140 protein [Foetidibacter luteolus]